jgi:hypothetical protein
MQGEASFAVHKLLTANKANFFRETSLGFEPGFCLPKIHYCSDLKKAELYVVEPGSK